MTELTQSIREFWDAQADTHRDNLLASTPDLIAKDLEMAAFLRHLPKGGRILDVGSGNGTMTRLLARQRPDATFVGVDFSARMVDVANAALEDDPDVRDRVTFEQADATSLPFEAEAFDCIYSDRCIINLVTIEDQSKALREIRRMLPRGGLYLMCENTKQGLSRLNALREIVQLPRIDERWHNRYLDELALQPVINSAFTTESADDFASTYYLVSRVLQAKLANDAGEQPAYDHPLNRIAAQLPPIGEFGPLRMIRLIAR